MSDKSSPDKYYLKISGYVIGVVVICALLIKGIIYWTNTVAFFSTVLSVLSPFLIGIFIAYLVHPLVRRFEKNLFYNICHIKSQKLRQLLAIIVSYTIVIGFLTVFLIVVIPQLGDSLYDLTGLIKTGYEFVTNFFMDLEHNYPDLNFEILDSALDQLFPTIINYISNLVGNTIPLLYSASVSVVTWILNILIAIIVSCYILADRKLLLNHFKRLLFAIFSEERSEAIISTLQSCNGIFGGFIIGKVIDSLIIGVLCAIILLIFRMPFVVLISVIVGVTNMIPYFGPIIGAVPGFLIIVISSPRQAIVYIILIVILQQFDGNILGPKILGDSTGIRPLWIIFAITVGGWLAGPIGMFLGVPTVAVIAFLVNNWVTARLAKKGITLPDYTKTVTEKPKKKRRWTKKNEEN